VPATIVLGTRSTDPEFNGDCDYAVMQLTPELMEQIHRRVELARQVGSQDDDFTNCILERHGGVSTTAI